MGKNLLRYDLTFALTVNHGSGARLPKCLGTWYILPGSCLLAAPTPTPGLNCAAGPCPVPAACCSHALAVHIPVPAFFADGLAFFPLVLPLVLPLSFYFFLLLHHSF